MVLHLHYHTNPVQLFGCFPDWSWTQTVSSSLNLDNSLVCSVSSSALLECRSESGSSLCFKVSSHCGCYWSCPCVMGMKSLSRRPKRTCAGLRSESFSGVFLYLSSETTRWCPLSTVQGTITLQVVSGDSLYLFHRPLGPLVGVGILCS